MLTAKERQKKYVKVQLMLLCAAIMQHKTSCVKYVHKPHWC